MKLSRTIAYAIHATLQLAGGERGVPIPCSQLANSGNMPERFLLQILRSLVTHGLLCSTRGVDGGYYLARPPERISLRDVIEAFDNPLNSSIPTLDGLKPAVCEQIKNTLDNASASAYEQLAKLTMADLLHADAESKE